MSKTRGHSSKGRASARTSLYQEVTGRIVAELEQGRVPWVQPWGETKAGLSLPLNALTGRRYSGINILILWNAVIAKGFSHHQWLTFRQALGLGGHVRKGEHGTTICYADRFIPRGTHDDRDEEPTAIPFLKRFSVFNIDQCEDLPEKFFVRPPACPDSAVIPEAEALIRATGADFRVGGDRAFYVPSADYIQVPPQGAFFEPINFFRTAYHELSHWSGAKHRLGRDLSGSFGSASYGREELVAEMSSAFICASLGITPTVRHTDYLGAWLEILREDNRAIFRAASQASKAADFILAFGEHETREEAEDAA